MPTKILLDTDIDIVGDIDDAMCLAYLLAQPECDLLGITTVTWDTVQRAMVASAICKAAGRQVPIYPGVSTPLLVPLPSVSGTQPPQVEREVLDRWEHDETFPRGQAVEFMRQTIRAHPGEVVLLAIGPLTNVALLLAADPEIAGLLRGLVLMGGMFTSVVPGTGMREWNALVDPHATAMVYRAPVRWHRSVGLDITCDLHMSAADVRERLGGERPSLLRDMAELWFRKAGGITFHDPLTAATIFDESICRFEPGAVVVELESRRLQGLTYWNPSGDRPPHEVAVSLDPRRFFEHYFALVR